MNVKQVIVIRKDLKMRRGKEIAQGSHASIMFLINRLKGGKTEVILSDVEQEWIKTGYTKICLQVNSEHELEQMFQLAIDAGFEADLITDFGKTEFNNIPTKTALAIGPDISEKIDKITSGLKLY